MLRCRDGSYYVGHTDQLEHRIGQHQSGEVPGYTQKRLPVKMVWSAEFPTRIEALEAEQQIKGWSRAKKEALIREDWPAIRRLASRAKILRDGAEPSTSSVSAPPQDERSFSPSLRPEERPSPDEGAPLEAAPPPVIVLVRPQLGENIGKAARAMLNFGLTELRLVAPRDGWPEGHAYADWVRSQGANLADLVKDPAGVPAPRPRHRDPARLPSAVRRPRHRARPGHLRPRQRGFGRGDRAVRRGARPGPARRRGDRGGLRQAPVLGPHRLTVTAGRGARSASDEPRGLATLTGSRGSAVAGLAPRPAAGTRSGSQRRIRPAIRRPTSTTETRSRPAISERWNHAAMSVLPSSSWVSSPPTTWAR